MLSRHCLLLKAEARKAAEAATAARKAADEGIKAAAVAATQGANGGGANGGSGSSNPNDILKINVEMLGNKDEYTLTKKSTGGTISAKPAAPKPAPAP